MVEIAAWWLSPQNVHCAVTTLRGPGLSASSPAGPGVSDPKEPRCWAAEHLQALECARASFLQSPHSQHQGGALISPWACRGRESQRDPSMTSQGALMTGTEKKAQLKIQQRGSGQGPGREGKVGEATEQSEGRRM